MSELIPNALVDSLSIDSTKIEGSAPAIGAIMGPEELLVLTSSLGIFSWSEMMYVVSGVQNRQGIETNDTGFRYPTDELDPGEEAFAGVKVFNPLGEVQVSVPAFERLMVRYFRALITGAETHQAPVVTQSWWPEFIEATELIERRLQQG